MSVRRPLKVGLVQMAMGEEPAPNLAKAVDGVREAAGRGAKLVVLPELFSSRYFCQTEDAKLFALAEPVPGPSSDSLAALAKELGVTLVASLFEKRAAGVFHNTAAVLDADGRYLGKYRKMHIPDDPRYYEKFYFAPGDLGFKTFQTAAAQIGVLVCWDQWYPEAARLTALQGAEILVYPTAIGWHPDEKATYGEHQHAAWETIQRSHAIANGCFVVAVNRVGFEPDPSASGDPRRHRVLGPELHRRARRSRRRARAGGSRGGARRGDRPRGDRREPDRLAVLPRPAHRRVRRDHEALRRRGLTLAPASSFSRHGTCTCLRDL